MIEKQTDLLLDSRLDAINDAQKRARLAMALCTFASATVLAGLWNLYASWDVLWAEGTKPENWNAEQVTLRQIGSWVDANTVGVSLLGIRLSTSDAAVTGAVILLGLAFYHCLSARRENHEVGALLVESMDESREIRHLIFRRIAAFMVSINADANDAAYDNLEGTRPSKTIPLFHSGLRMLVCLPAITIAAIIASDVYYGLWYVSPLAQDGGPGAWSTLSLMYKVKLVSMDVSGIAFGVVTSYYCYQTILYREATEKIVTSFGSVLNGAPSVVIARPGSDESSESAEPTCA